jgi:hypothetical protein
MISVAIYHEIRVENKHDEEKYFLNRVDEVQVSCFTKTDVYFP